MTTLPVEERLARLERAIRAILETFEPNKLESLVENVSLPDAWRDEVREIIEVHKLFCG